MSLLNNPEGIGRAGGKAFDYVQDKYLSPALKERQDNTRMTIGCIVFGAFIASCSAIGFKLGLDALNAPPAPTPTKPSSAATHDTRSYYSTSTPQPTESPKLTVYRVEIKRGDTIWELVQAIEQQYPAGVSYVYYNSRTGKSSVLLSRESVLKIHSIVPGDALIYFLP